MTRSASLTEVLARAQQLGFLGDRPIEEVVEHSQAFVRALDGVTGTVLDLGSGGGIPGLVIAAERPDLLVTLLDRRAKRTDFLERHVRRLGWSERVDVVQDDADLWWRRLAHRFDGVVARGFGPPEVTLRTAVRYLAPEGIIVISDPPSGDRWPPELLAELGLARRPERDRIATFSPLR